MLKPVNDEMLVEMRDEIGNISTMTVGDCFSYALSLGDSQAQSRRKIEGMNFQDDCFQIASEFLNHYLSIRPNLLKLGVVGIENRGGKSGPDIVITKGRNNRIAVVNIGCKKSARERVTQDAYAALKKEGLWVEMVGNETLRKRTSIREKCRTIDLVGSIYDPASMAETWSSVEKYLDEHIFTSEYIQKMAGVWINPLSK